MMIIDPFVSVSVFGLGEPDSVAETVLWDRKENGGFPGMYPILFYSILICIICVAVRDGIC